MRLANTYSIIGEFKKAEEYFSIASKKTPLEECNEYVNAKGWKQFVPFNIGNKKLLVICGSSTINEPPSSNNFFSSRSIAFDSAILDAQKSYAEFRYNKISEKISFKLHEGFGLHQEYPITKDSELTQEIEEKICKFCGLFKDDYMYANIR